MIRGDLHETVPQIIIDEIASFFNQLQGDLDEPHSIVNAVPFGQNSRLQRQLFTNIEIRCNEVVEQLVNDGVHVGGVAHGKEQRQRALANGYIRIVQ